MCAAGKDGAHCNLCHNPSCLEACFLQSPFLRWQPRSEGKKLSTSIMTKGGRLQFYSTVSIPLCAAFLIVEKEHVSAQESPWNFVFYFKYFCWCFSQPEVQSALLFFIATDRCIVIVFIWWGFLSQSQSLLYQWGLQFNYVFWKKALPLCFWSHYLIIALDLHLYCIWKQVLLVSLTLMGSKQKFTMLIQLLHAPGCCRSRMLKNILQFLQCFCVQAEKGSTARHWQ